MKNLCIVILLFSTISAVAESQSWIRMTHAEYINKYKDDAIRDMKRAGVPASITLAQGILESDAGNSRLAREANNHFGIKCHVGWTGDTFYQDDDEKNECFRKYRTVLESYDDHARFLRDRERYAFLFEYDITDYKKWAHGLKKAGYATNPRYADLLIRIIEENNLSVYDRDGHNMPVDDKDPSALAVKPVREEDNGSATGNNLNFNSNHVPYIIAKKGDTWYSVAVKNELRMWQILKYNDAGETESLQEGDIIYLKPKRGKSAVKTHIVQEGDNLRSVSQRYGVKMKTLIKVNHFDHDLELKPGQEIKLR